LSFTATVSIKTCSSYADSYVTIVNSNGIEIAFYDEDNCGYYSYGYNEDLLVSLPAGNYEVRVYSFWADYSWYSLEVAIIGCGGNEASDSVDVYSLSEDSEEVNLDFVHPLSSSIEVVSTDNCASTWDGRLGSGWTYYGQIGISLVETTTVSLVTCGSELDTVIELTQHFADGSDLFIQTFDHDNCRTDGDGYYGSHYVNEDVSVELSPGHYTVSVTGYSSMWGEHATLEVYVDGCTTQSPSLAPTAEPAMGFSQIPATTSAVLIGVSIASTLCCVSIIVGIAYCCCFKARTPARRAMEGSQNGVQAFDQSPGSKVQMLQLQPAMVQQCVYTSE